MTIVVKFHTNVPEKVGKAQEALRKLKQAGMWWESPKKYKQSCRCCTGPAWKQWRPAYLKGWGHERVRMEILLFISFYLGLVNLCMVGDTCLFSYKEDPCLCWWGEWSMNLCTKASKDPEAFLMVEVPRARVTMRKSSEVHWRSPLLQQTG